MYKYFNTKRSSFSQKKMDQNIRSMNSLKSVLDTVARLQVRSPTTTVSDSSVLSRVTTSLLAVQTDGQYLHHDRACPEKNK